MTPGERHKFSGGEIARKYKTPLASLYRVAALVRAANSEWNRFVKLAFSKRGQELVSDEMRTALTGYFTTNQSGSNQPVNPSGSVPRFTKLSDIL
jgi:hypothetical protein